MSFESDDKPCKVINYTIPYLKTQTIRVVGVPVISANSKSTVDDDKGFIEIDYDKLEGGDFSYVVKICDIQGTMIQVNAMEVDGYDLFEVCDDESADLGHVISALKDVDGPMNDDTGKPYMDVYYIDGIEFEKSISLVVKKRIIAELPAIVFHFFNIKPDILAYIPALVGEERMSEKEKAERLASSNRVGENLEAFTNKMIHPDDMPYQPPKHPISRKMWILFLVAGVSVKKAIYRRTIRFTR